MYVIIIDIKKAMNFKEHREGNIGVFGGEKVRGEM